MRIRLFCIFMLVALALPACMSSPAKVETPAVTETFAEVTSPTTPPTLTATVTEQPTATYTATLTQPPTNTPEPSLTPTPEYVIEKTTDFQKCVVEKTCQEAPLDMFLSENGAEPEMTKLLREQDLLYPITGKEVLDLPRYYAGGTPDVFDPYSQQVKDFAKQVYLTGGKINEDILPIRTVPAIFFVPEVSGFIFPVQFINVNHTDTIKYFYIPESWITGKWRTGTLGWINGVSKNSVYPNSVLVDLKDKNDIHNSMFDFIIDFRDKAGYNYEQSKSDYDSWANTGIFPPDANIEAVAKMNGW